MAVAMSGGSINIHGDEDDGGIRREYYRCSTARYSSIIAHGTRKLNGVKVPPTLLSLYPPHTIIAGGALSPTCLHHASARDRPRHNPGISWVDS